ncbi:hypothetical protein BegalDRAFT_1478 [Beggiatoa alba B18LD]|uniref:Uncharacterized protein n=1 Tax=Beggiatoa alba B18LD TaxID=395493 RepID=I3CFH3_9GAMM|nr:hypothetical protein [Beggiatoa alba]EIJ42366.1 hypothetical protein BegalDRAFT_1478 [Beggiatoa alba B18LD]
MNEHNLKDVQALLKVIEHCRNSSIFFLKFTIKPLHLDYPTLKDIPEIERIVQEGVSIPYVENSGLPLEKQFASELLNQLEAYLEACLN